MTNASLTDPLNAAAYRQGLGRAMWLMKEAFRQEGVTIFAEKLGYDRIAAEMAAGLPPSGADDLDESPAASSAENASSGDSLERGARARWWFRDSTSEWVLIVDAQGEDCSAGFRFSSKTKDEAIARIGYNPTDEELAEHQVEALPPLPVCPRLTDWNAAEKAAIAGYAREAIAAVLQSALPSETWPLVGEQCAVALENEQQTFYQLGRAFQPAGYVRAFFRAYPNLVQRDWYKETPQAELAK